MHLVDRPLTMSPFNCSEYTVDVAAGVVEEMPKRDGVIIFGAGHGHREAPLDDPRWSVWALNTVAPLDSLGRLRADRWFELHQRCAQTEQDMAWLAKCPVPLYVPPDLVDVNPLCVRFPLEKLEREFAPYWSCTFAYQLALAMSEGYTHIGLYGVELAYGTPRERTVEWACVSWWLGFAAALRIKIYLPRHSRLTQHSHRYGLDYDAEKNATDDYIELTRELDRARDGDEGMGG